MTEARFTRPADPGAEIHFMLDGRPATARQGDSVAAALLAMDARATRRTGLSGTGRAPFCMMGVCFDCLVTIDGIANRQGCMVEIIDGMVVDRQAGFRASEGLS